MSNEKKGYFGDFGGAFVPEALKIALKDLEDNFYRFSKDESFLQELAYYQKQYTGRPNPLYYAEKLTAHIGGAKIYLKREDLNHTGSHKINNTIGQVLLAKRMGKNRIIAETGAGQHGVATATACAFFGMDCTIYMGAKDIKRQELNVFRMELLGAKVIAVDYGTQTLKDAVDAALADFMENVSITYYMLGSAVGPHPYPTMVREFQKVIGLEAKEQILESENRLPDYLVAAVGGGSNAIGLFHPFIEDEEVRIIGVEAGGTLTKGKPGIIHGFKCLLLQDDYGNPLPVHSIAAGLDYPGAGPEHCFYKANGRVNYVSITNDEALEAFNLLSKVEGIIPAIESSHAVAYAAKLAKNISKEKIVIVNLSGRGDKDVMQVKDMLAKTNRYHD